MTVESPERDDPIERHLRTALDSAADADARYHLREALQLRIAERNGVRVGS